MMTLPFFLLSAPTSLPAVEANLLPIVATTNFTGDTFAERLSADKGAPMVRRIREFCQSVAV